MVVLSGVSRGWAPIRSGASLSSAACWASPAAGEQYTQSSIVRRAGWQENSCLWKTVLSFSWECRSVRHFQEKTGR